jgi:hypothetical protein
MAGVLQIHEDRPAWQAAVTAPTHAVLGAGVAWLLIKSVTVLQSGAISAVSNLVACVFANFLRDAADSVDERVQDYHCCHIVTVPLVALVASLALGWSISIPAVLVLTVTNVVASILGILVTDIICADQPEPLSGRDSDEEGSVHEDSDDEIYGFEKKPKPELGANKSRAVVEEEPAAEQPPSASDAGHVEEPAVELPPSASDAGHIGAQQQDGVPNFFPMQHEMWVKIPKSNNEFPNSLK